MAKERTRRLTTLFEEVLKGKKTAASNNPKLFLEAICMQIPAVTCISRLVTSIHGLETLLLALSSDTSLPFLNGQLTTFLEYIKGPNLQTVCGGDVIQQVLAKLVEAPLTWKSLVKAAQDQTLEQRALSVFAWLLIQLLSLPVKKAVAYLTVAQDPAIQRALMSSSGDVGVLGQQIVQIAKTLAKGENYALWGPGGRHDNDFPKIQRISIYPTQDELKLKALDFYLPRASDMQERAEDPDGFASHIESQFRLLRENMLCELREELAAFAEPKEWHRKPLEIKSLALSGVHCGKRHPWSLQFKCVRDLPQLRDLDDKKRVQFLEDNPKFLKHGLQVSLFVGKEFVALGSLVREEDLLVKSPSILCIQIPAKDVGKVLMQLKNAGSGVRLLQLDTAMFTYEPVLKQLQKMSQLSLSPEIVNWQPGTSILPMEYNLNSTMKQLLQDLRKDYTCNLQSCLELTKPTRLDKAQAECFQAALEQRVVLIQGPPGTGKSFIGSLVAKAIHQSSDEKILVVCYTHHALDDFLEHLLNLGIPPDDIVRLGSTHKATESTKPLALKENKDYIFTKKQQAVLDEKKQELTEQAENLRKAFFKFNPRRNPRELLKFLESYDDDLPFHTAFQMPKDPDGMTWVGSKGEKLDECYLIKRWSKGKGAGIFRSEVPRNCSAVWRLKREVRKQKQTQWYHEMSKDGVAQVCEAGKLYNHAVKKIDAVFLKPDLAVMKNKRIIACTTTAAAKYSNAIQRVSPGVLLVEEAGEILESHVLTALGPNTKHLILIGDHKQLRPKVSYELSVEKGTGYDLNRSLFERLILKGFPHQTLFSQHRMRPEISALVREMTYPELKDANDTQRRPNLRGFSDNIIFVNHNEPETELKCMPKFGDSKSISSKQNLFEAKMTLKCVRYLGQQGYRTDDIVVLTPYLGQLRLLHDELKVDNDPVLNDLDSHDLIRAGLMPKKTGEVNKRGLRISTIDNFQGEEANIVVASLTRSNSQNDIGFMSAPERLNVLISRARNALILIGNAEHFMGSRKGGDLWKRFISLLKAGMHVYDGFPIHCEHHPDRTAILQKPADFDTECPDGGCKELCTKILNCGIHKCPDHCHYLDDHSNIDCKAAISFKCDKGHVYNRECHVRDFCSDCRIEGKKAVEKDLKELLSQMAEIDKEIQAIHDEAEGTENASEGVIVHEEKPGDLETTKDVGRSKSVSADTPNTPTVETNITELRSDPKLEELWHCWQDCESMLMLAENDNEILTIRAVFADQLAFILKEKRKDLQSAKNFAKKKLASISALEKDLKELLSQMAEIDKEIQAIQDEAEGTEITSEGVIVHEEKPGDLETTKDVGRRESVSADTPNTPTVETNVTELRSDPKLKELWHCWQDCESMLMLAENDNEILTIRAVFADQLAFILKKKKKDFQSAKNFAKKKLASISASNAQIIATDATELTPHTTLNSHPQPLLQSARTDGKIQTIRTEATKQLRERKKRDFSHTTNSFAGRKFASHKPPNGLTMSGNGASRTLNRTSNSQRHQYLLEEAKIEHEIQAARTEAAKQQVIAIEQKMKNLQITKDVANRKSALKKTSNTPTVDPNAAGSTPDQTSNWQHSLLRARIDLEIEVGRSKAAKQRLIALKHKKTDLYPSKDVAGRRLASKKRPDTRTEGSNASGPIRNRTSYNQRQRELFERARIDHKTQAVHNKAPKQRFIEQKRKNFQIAEDIPSRRLASKKTPNSLIMGSNAAGPAPSSQFQHLRRAKINLTTRPEFCKYQVRGVSASHSGPEGTEKASIRQAMAEKSELKK